ncbi:MAG: CRISPR-associated endonuclease Cas1 [Puniceicoccales bacterium]|jgi:CRISPR-associated protein Cas1|nr:CRISPR-associated endonuclease Cas1 [Puniceicoccales bacterium]
MSDSSLRSEDSVQDMPFMGVRNMHNYLYCPRLFYLQWVENLFENNADTVAGDAAHRKVDMPSRMDDAKEAALRSNLTEGQKFRSLHLTSATLGLTGIVDMVEGGGSDGVTVVDYKKGAPRHLDDGSYVAKDPDAAQVAAYALLLREQGTNVAGASIYYAAEKKRIPVELSDALFARVHTALAEARAVAASGKIPPPLPDDARCLYCSAYPICLPRESAWWQRHHVAHQDRDTRTPPLPGFEDLLSPDSAIREIPAPDLADQPPRPPRLDGEILIVQTPGAMVGQSGGEFTVSVKKEVLRKLPKHQVRAIYLYGAIQLTAQAAQSALEEEIDVAYFAPSGRFLGMLRGLPASGVDARLGQYDLFRQPFAKLRLAGEAIRAKIHNQRVLLMRNGDPGSGVLFEMARLRDAAPQALSLEELLGIEGAAANFYFQQFPTMLKDRATWAFDFNGRNRRPPRDPVNALLSFGYSMLAKELAGVCHVVGLDPFLGFMHQPRYGRPALALDLMEEFRPLVADSVALSLINRGELAEGDFIRSASGTSLNERGRRIYWEAWFRRLDTEVSHPAFGYKMSYRRMFEVQARQLWRHVRGDAAQYHGFTTR